MARRKPTRSKRTPSPGSRGPRGFRGRRGVSGPAGPAGPPGAAGVGTIDLAQILARVTQELEGIQATLRVQFTRIADLQAELDHVRLAVEKPS